MDLSDYQVKKKKNLHSDKHLLIDEVRKTFGDTAKKGIGSFGFYLGLLKGVSVSVIRRIFREIMEGNAKSPRKLFTWKIKEFKKKQLDKSKYSPMPSNLHY